MASYNPSDIEPKWQKHWEDNQTFKTSSKTVKPKYYCLDMFPYPSGSGLHVGHPEGYTATDIICRYKRAKGFNVLHPMGWDAFGLPAEQYAIQTGTHPAETTKKNCDNFRRQIKSLGLSYDWDREINTTDPGYFKWTQWIFTKLYNTWFDDKEQKGKPISELPIPKEIAEQGEGVVKKYQDDKRLAYYDNAQVWFCNTCKTVCANEEILQDGSHEKCGTKEVSKKDLKQWQLRIAHYAERLLKGLDEVDWPQGIKDMQRNWVGKSTGAEVDFKIVDNSNKLTVYTTRPDTLFGATYMVVSPEHELLQEITSSEQKNAVEEYCKAASLKSDLERTELAKEKSGVFTGSFGVNPLTEEEVPIWVADYVLTGYGTGAIMAVPAHDIRDFEFAKMFSLPVKCILEPNFQNASVDQLACYKWDKNECQKLIKSKEGQSQIRQAVLSGEECWAGNGKAVHSANKTLDINGQKKKDAIRSVTSWLIDQGLGEFKINYKLRDWLFSRQRFWGEPFPIIHWEDGEVSTIDTQDLPLKLPDLEDYHPSDSGESPLANAGEWLEVVDKNGRKGRRETNTMPQWAGSCWYYLRYIDPKNDENPFDKALENYWMPVDLYVGGAEHAVLHLLYSRFWHKVLFDLGVVSTNEPFQKLFNQGMILAFAYETKAGSKVPSDQVEEKESQFFHKETGEELKQIVAKMSKSLRNVVNPDDVVEKHGADSLRLYEMFMGPLEATKPWQTSGLDGQNRFLQKVYRNFIGEENKTIEVVNDEPPKELHRLMHETILKIESDIENLRFNTSISQLMILNNEICKQDQRYREVQETFTQLLAPFAPHLAEELWEYLGKKDLSFSPWPLGDPAKAVKDEVVIVFQINGKVKCKVELPKQTPKNELEDIAKNHEKFKTYLENVQIIKAIAVPGKLVNFVVKPN
jgi:leucyl-tRNA synthetase